VCGGLVGGEHSYLKLPVPLNQLPCATTRNCEFSVTAITSFQFFYSDKQETSQTTPPPELQYG
jgi:hypothetical protein